MRPGPVGDVSRTEPDRRGRRAGGARAQTVHAPRYGVRSGEVGHQPRACDQPPGGPGAGAETVRRRAASLRARGEPGLAGPGELLPGARALKARTLRARAYVL